MTDVLAPEDLLTDLSTAHHDIRSLLARLEQEPGARIDVADELHLMIARHRTRCTEAVLHLAVRDGADHEAQCRLLTAATHGIEQLVDRLRLPARDDRMIDNLVQALRGLVYEHERLELELALVSAAVDEAAPAARNGRL